MAGLAWEGPIYSKWASGGDGPVMLSVGQVDRIIYTAMFYRHAPRTLLGAREGEGEWGPAKDGVRNLDVSSIESVK